MRYLMLIGTFLLCLDSNTKAQEIARYKGNARAAFSYTFDDGLEEHYTVVFPHLKALGLKATFWIIGRNIDQHKLAREAPPMTWDMVAEMCRDGQEIASHTYSHVNMTKIDSMGWAREIFRNDSAIYAHTGVHAVTLAFPGNRKSPELLDYISRRSDLIASRNEQISMGGKFAGGGVSDSLMTNPFDDLLQRTLREGSWTVTMTHAIYKGYDCFADEMQVERFWQHLYDAKALADKGELWVAPFRDVAAYVNGKSDTVTYILGTVRPRSVRQGRKKLTPYQSWDGKWCVDAKRRGDIKILRN